MFLEGIGVAAPARRLLIASVVLASRGGMGLVPIIALVTDGMSVVRIRSSAFSQACSALTIDLHLLNASFTCRFVNLTRYGQGIRPPPKMKRGDFHGKRFVALSLIKGWKTAEV
jgi:hypothetical protein